MDAAMIDVALVDPEDPAAQQCLRAYEAELDTRFATGFDPARSISVRPEEVRPPRGLFLVASLHGDPVGCGALKFHGDQPADVKRMWVSQTVRGLGIGRRLLAELEAQAAGHGVSMLRLETNGALTEAIGLYRSAGYVEVAAFNEEPYSDHWFEKRIDPVPENRDDLAG